MSSNTDIPQTLVNPDIPTKTSFSVGVRDSLAMRGPLEPGWMGNVEAVPGPSTLPSTPIFPGHYSSSNSLYGDTVSEDEFAERFKYIICSSGILEKDYVPGLGGASRDISITTIPNAESDLGDEAAHDQEDEVPLRLPQRRDTLHKLEVGVTVARQWTSSTIMAQWDMILAFVALGIGLWTLAQLKIVVTALISVGGVWALWVLMTRPGSVGARMVVQANFIHRSRWITRLENPRTTIELRFFTPFLTWSLR